MKSTTQSHISLPENFHHTPAASNGRSFSVPPRRYSDGRPYYSLNAWLKDQFGQKIYKLALDGGMTCPNRDGRIDTRGCIRWERAAAFSAATAVPAILQSRLTPP